MNKAREFLDKCGKVFEENTVNTPVSSAPPTELHIELTYRCNTNCIMCNLRYINKPENELTVEQWKELIEGSRLLKDVRYIVLSGGEAWLKEDLIELVKYLKKNYPETGILILSNLIDAELALNNIREIKNTVGLKNISIGSSLDGVGPAHDKIRGKKGSFNLLSNTLKFIKKDYPELYFSLNFTLTPENCTQMLPVYEWCSDNGYHVSFQVMVQKKETKEFIWKKEHIEIVRAQLDALIDGLIARSAPEIKDPSKLLLNEGLLSMLLSVHYIEKYIVERRRFFPDCPCGQKYAMLDPYGNLYFCPVHKDLIAGNALEDGFDELWHSPKANEIREFFNRKTCHCWLTCTNGYMLGEAIRTGRDKCLKNVLFPESAAGEAGAKRTQ